jgi:hypothetical protein
MSEGAYPRILTGRSVSVSSALKFIDDNAEQVSQNRESFLQFWKLNEQKVKDFRSEEIEEVITQTCHIWYVEDK